MRFYRFVAVSAFCLGFVFPCAAQTASASQPQTDNQEEPDQPVAQAGNTAPDKPEDMQSVAWQSLDDGLKDPKLQVRVDAVNAIGTLSGINRAETALQSAMQDKEIEVRVAAVVAAGSMQDENLLPVLRQMLDDATPEVAYAAAVSLWKMHDPSGINLLYAVVAGERRTKGSAVHSGLHEANRDLHDPGTLGKIGAEEGAYALLGPFGIGLGAARYVMKSNDANSARVLVVNLLAQDHSDPTKDELIAALGDKSYFVRAASARALGGFRGKEVTDALQNLFDDKKPSVRLMAAASYIRCNQPVPVPVQPKPKPRTRSTKRLK